jgi:hypothetical protein
MKVMDRIVYLVMDWILSNFYLFMGIMAALFIIVIILGWG